MAHKYSAPSAPSAGSTLLRWAGFGFLLFAISACGVTSTGTVSANDDGNQDVNIDNSAPTTTTIAEESTETSAAAAELDTTPIIDSCDELSGTLQPFDFSNSENSPDLTIALQGPAGLADLLSEIRLDIAGTEGTSNWEWQSSDSANGDTGIQLGAPCSATVSIGGRGAGEIGPLEVGDGPWRYDVLIVTRTDKAFRSFVVVDQSSDTSSAQALIFRSAPMPEPEPEPEPIRSFVEPEFVVAEVETYLMHLADGNYAEAVAMTMRADFEWEPIPSISPDLPPAEQLEQWCKVAICEPPESVNVIDKEGLSFTVEVMWTTGERGEIDVVILEGLNVRGVPPRHSG